MSILAYPQMTEIIPYVESNTLANRQVQQRVSVDRLKPFQQVVLNSVRSKHSKRAYESALNEFFEWLLENGEPMLCKAVLQYYIESLRTRGLGPASINQRLAAIRALFREARDNGVVESTAANPIIDLKGEKKEGRRTGNWLTLKQAQDLINIPDISTVKGLRDRALFAIEIGCWLRRDECCANLTFDQLQQREGRWVIVNLVGKRKKTRSVPVPSWAKAAVDAWTEAAGISSGFVFRSIDRWGHVSEGNTPAQTLYEICELYGKRVGVKVAPHDLRRTGAQLAYKAGADLKQIQLTLGHESIKTTEIYLGIEQDLTDAPCDKIKIKLSAD